MLHKSNIISRRTAIRQFLVLTTVTAFVPSCLQDAKKPSIPLHHISVDAEEENLLAELTETIIPRTETPGAKDISAHIFVLRMVDDCYEKKDREAFIEGFKEFQKLAKEKFNKSFIALGAEQKSELLHELEGMDPTQSVPGGFYAAVKKLTVQAYLSSEFYLTKVQVYELVPARFHGCVPLKKAS